MNLNLIFARDGLLPIAAHAYTVSGILPQECDTFRSDEFSSKFGFEAKGKITVDPDTCIKVWRELQGQPVHAERASNMLATVMADSHVFGFVATGKDETGKDLTVVSFRGTHFVSEWLRGIGFSGVPFRSEAGLVQIGFQAIYGTLRNSVLSQLGNNRLPLIIVGHSLGAALATLCALDPEVAKLSNGPIKVVTFASPRVGDTDFKNAFGKNVTDCLRIANWSDLVPHLPFHLPLQSTYCHVGQAAIIDGGFTLDLGEAHGLCAGYIRGLNRTIAEPVTLQALD